MTPETSTDLSAPQRAMAPSAADRSAYVLRLGDDALVYAQRLGGVDRRRPAARGGRRARQHRARPARPGALPPDVCRPGRGGGPRRGRAGVPPRRARLPQRPDLRAAARRLRRHRSPGCSSWRPTSSSSTPTSSHRPTRRSRRSRPRPSRRSTTTATTRPSGRCDSATAPTSHTCACSAGSTTLWPYVAELFETDDLVRRLAESGIAVDPVDTRGPRHGVPRPRPRRGHARPSRDARAAHRRSPRHPHRGDGLPARRDAAPGALTPRGHLVTDRDDSGPSRRQQVRAESSPRCSTPRCRS